MKHLSREELIDSLERTLPAAREAHVDACSACRQERDALQQVLQRVVTVEVPEPSPLFWEHFGARIGEAVARQPEPAASRWPSLGSWLSFGWPRWAVAAMMLVVGVTLGWTGWRDYGHKHRSNAVVKEAADTVDPLGYAASPDEDWNLVVSMAEDVTVDDADGPGLPVPPEATDHAFSDLSAEQRSEMARLLTVEMTRPAS